MTVGNRHRECVGQNCPPPGDLGGGQEAGTAAEAAGGAAEEAAGAADEAAAAADELDPASIDQEARDKAAQMLGGEQMTQQMGQMFGQAAQAGAQAGQQLSQQLNQVGQQMGQAVQQAGQQLGQLVGKAGLGAPDIGAAALDGLGAAADLGAGGGGDFGGGIPDFGGGAGFGGGGFGDMGGDGIGEEPGNDAAPGMTTSAALLPPPLTQPGTGPSAQSAAAGRVPAMMPMMPMAAGAAAQQGAGNTTKRDPVIFAERPLYETPDGVEQTIGARPEIESEEPPFGETEAAGR